MSADKEHEMWEQFDRVMKEADKVHGMANDLFKQTHQFQGEAVSTGKSHTLRFSADTLTERRQLFWRFLKMAFQAGWHGKTEFQFRAKH